MHLGRGRLCRRLNGIVEQVGHHDDQMRPIQRDVFQVREVKVHHDPFPGCFLVLFAEQSVQQGLWVLRMALFIWMVLLMEVR